MLHSITLQVKLCCVRDTETSWKRLLTAADGEAVSKDAAEVAFFWTEQRRHVTDTDPPANQERW